MVLIRNYFMLRNEWTIYVNCGPPICDRPIKGHTYHNKATLSENTPCIIVSKATLK